LCYPWTIFEKIAALGIYEMVQLFGGCRFFNPRYLSSFPFNVCAFANEMNAVTLVKCAFGKDTKTNKK
jgi:hypothetical protein